MTLIFFAAGRRLGRRKLSASFLFSVLRVEHIRHAMAATVGEPRSGLDRTGSHLSDPRDGDHKPRQNRRD